MIFVTHRHYRDIVLHLHSEELHLNWYASNYKSVCCDDVFYQLLKYISEVSNSWILSTINLLLYLLFCNEGDLRQEGFSNELFMKMSYIFKNI